MREPLKKYCRIFLGLLPVFLLVFHAGLASSDQEMVALTAQSIGTGLGESAPASAYNPNLNEYLVVYVKTDASCSGERLFGITIDAITGAKGSEFAISDCNINITDPDIIYNPSLDEYLVLYKSLGNIGSKSRLYYAGINASNLAISLSPTKLIGDDIADPYNGLVLGLDEQSGIYTLGFHKTNSSDESVFTVNFLNATSKTIQGYKTVIDKTSFTETNAGIFNSKLVFNGNNVVVIFEQRINSGSEIWGGFLNETNGSIIGDFFQVSPGGSADPYYTNPDVLYIPESDELVVGYEESYYSDPGGAFVLSKNIRMQKLAGQTGELTGTSNVALPPLPGTGNTEDMKKPSLSRSPLSKEILVTYYGIRFAAGTDTYNLYLHRLASSTFNSISSSSIKIDNGIGNQVLQNNSAKPIAFSHNPSNNQFLVSWMNENNLVVKAQIWRYDNNPPTDLRIAGDTKNENEPIGTTFTTFSAEDPDPEDATITYKLISGTGDDDNNKFSINGNKLLVYKNLNHEEKETLSILVRASDTNGASTKSRFDLFVNDIPEKPSDIQLSDPLEIVENAKDFISAILVLDEDANDTHTSKLVSGDSSDNNVNFEIINESTLQIKNPANYEDSSYQYVRIESKDAYGNTTSKAFAIKVTDINEPHDTVYISPGSIPENDPQAFVTVVIEDPDEYSDYSITLTEGEGGEDNHYFSPVDNKLIPDHEFDYEEKNEFNVRVMIKEGNYSDTIKLVIGVNDVNDTPDSLALTNNQIMDARGIGFSIGKLITYDQDQDDTHEYSLINGDDFFRIDSNDSLITKVPLVYSYENPSANFINIKVLSTDANNATVERSFTIEIIPFKDIENPQFHNLSQNPDFLLHQEEEVTLSVLATDNEQLDTIYFYYRKIRSEGDFIQAKSNIELNKTSDQSQIFEAMVSEGMLDDLGLEYRFKIFDVAGNDTLTPVQYLYIKYNSRQFNPTSYSYDGSATSYRIISNPYELGSNKVSAIFSDYGPSNKKNWRLFEYRNKKNNEIGTNLSAELKTGQGYWFNKSTELKDAIILEKPEPLEYNRISEANIILNQGWNLIGNPYPFAIDWKKVVAYNSNLNNGTPFFTYNKGYSGHNDLEAFEGAFVYVNQKTPIIIPVLENPDNGRKGEKNTIAYDWIVNFKLENKDIAYGISAIGMHQEALESYDQFDTPLLPRFASYTDISFDHPEHHSKSFTKDISSSQENYIWEFVASTEAKDKSFTLRWTQPAFNQSDKLLMLYDVSSDRVIDMSKVSEHKINLDDPVAFKAIYGDQQFIDQSLNEIYIQELKPYPNPFEVQVNLPVTLPTSIHQYDVYCNIYDLMGEKIFEKVDRNISPGMHNIVWGNQEAINNGIYIYSIKVKNKFVTREFHGRLVKD